MRTNDEFTKEEFIEQKERLVKKLDLNKSKITDSNDSMKTWLELIEEFLNTAFQIREILLEGTSEQKQTVLSRVGENYFISSKKLTFSFKQPYDVLLKPEYRTNVLEKWVQFRTTDWMTELDYPEYTAKEVRRFLTVSL